ncbi:F-box protein SKIP14 [Euphorbia lathyris]|uniref:F-box protein SKIP14 n=1 Tax=Euphorbia lathyris TaxID=212925 RepID=UPI0033144B25
MNLENSHFQGMKEAKLEVCSGVSSNDIADCLPVDPFGINIASSATTIDCLPVDPFGINISSSVTTIDCLPVDPFGMEIMPSGMVINCLPVDPFGSDINSRVTAIKDWLQEFDEDFESNFSKYGIDEAEKDTVRDGLLAGLDLFFNSAMKLQPEKGNLSLDAMLIRNHRADRFFDDHELTSGSFDPKDYIGNLVLGDKVKEVQEGGDPHDGLFYVLSYLGVDSLLVVERVCKSLRDAVRGDSLLWRSIHVDHPLNLKLTDEALVKLTTRAQGTLQCLSLVECIKITDNGLKQVLDSNPSLTKLGVPRCVRLSIDGILSNMRLLKSSGTLKIKQLRIGGIFCVTKEQFEELKFILDADDDRQLKVSRPCYYHLGQLYVSLDDDRAIDIEMCPKCQKVRLVYDCPAKGCQGKDTSQELCRACTLCIARCIYCGCCVDDSNYEETFCLDFLCVVCFKSLLSYEEKP